MDADGLVWVVFGIMELALLAVVLFCNKRYCERCGKRITHSAARLWKGECFECTVKGMMERERSKEDAKRKRDAEISRNHLN